MSSTEVTAWLWLDADNQRGTGVQAAADLLATRRMPTWICMLAALGHARAAA